MCDTRHKLQRWRNGIGRRGGWHDRAPDDPDYNHEQNERATRQMPSDQPHRQGALVNVRHCPRDRVLDDEKGEDEPMENLGEQVIGLKWGSLSHG